MLGNSLKLTYRDFKKSKISFLINVLGLSIGLAASVLILFWIHHESTFDRFHSNALNIYRVISSVRDQTTPLTAYPMGHVIASEVQGIRNIVRIRSNFGGIMLFEVGGAKFEETGILFADSSFFHVFSFSLAQGNSNEALSRPDGIVITREKAKKYFGSESALGKEIRINNNDLVTVSGVIDKIPTRSHLQFDFLLPMSFRARTDQSIINNNWDSFSFYTYVLFGDANQEAMGSIGQQVSRIHSMNTSSFSADFILQNITDIHLHSDYLYDVDGNGNFNYVRIFSIVALFILIIACINFTNLACARAIRRAKEVSMQKVLGARRSQLIISFFMESFLLTAISFLIAIVLVVAVMPAFAEITGNVVSLSDVDVTLVLLLLSIFLFTGLASGMYPAILLSGFQPIKVLKGIATKGSKGNLFRNSLVVAQFVVSITLIVCTIVVFRQLQFIRSTDIGYDKENLLFFPVNGELEKNIGALRSELESSELLKDYSVISELPLNLSTGTVGVNWSGKNQESRPMFFIMNVDENFHSVFKTTVVSGRTFGKEFTADTSSYLVNENALGLMGMNLASAVGQQISVFGKPGTIVGVLKNFNYQSVALPVGPMILTLNPGKGYVVIRTRSQDVDMTVSKLKALWEKLDISYEFNYDFIDQRWMSLYSDDIAVGRLLNMFAVLSIFISTLGLFGLAKFKAEQRVKEIGVRKVLGASTTGIFFLLLKDFIQLILIAFILAVPFAWYGMLNWLQTFAYRIDLEWWYFVVAGLLAVSIGALTLTYQSLRAAHVDPVKNLRTE